MEQKRKILITGGAGYIGTHVAKRLFDLGYLIYIVDFMQFHNPSSNIWGELFKVNLLDEKALDQVFEKTKPDIVIHLASFISVIESSFEPQKYYENNLEGSLHLLRCIKKHKTPHFIFSSSCAVYGNDSLQELTEQAPLNPKSPYARIKTFIETIVQDYAKAQTFSYINFRIFNVAGIDSKTGFKRSSTKPLSLIPKVTKNLKAEIFGHFFNTQDHTAICDYIHINDVTEYFAKACLYLLEDKTSETLNLGSGSGHSVLEVIQQIERLLNKKIPVVFTKERKEDSSFNVADMDKTTQTLSYKLRYSDLETIIKSEINNS